MNTRPLRGLLIHGLPTVEFRLKHGNHYCRDLIGSFMGKPHIMGTCIWCQREGTDRIKGWWHSECVTAHQLARGITANINGKPAIPRGPCANCEYNNEAATRLGRYGDNPMELDHATPLALVWARRNVREILMAYTVWNLQWLCHDCHAKKTGWDMRQINQARKGQATLL